MQPQNNIRTNEFMFLSRMCKGKSKKSTRTSHSTTSKPHNTSKSFNSSTPSYTTASSSSSSAGNLNYTSPSSSSSTANFNFLSSSSTTSASSWSTTSKKSLTNIKHSLSPENPNIYDFSEILTATQNFHSKPFSSSSSSTSWRCEIRKKDVIIFQRKLRLPIDLPELRLRLSTTCRTHHSSLVKLLGASISGSYIYLVYEFEPSCANLSACLRNPKNPNYTVLSTWVSRMQIAADIAHGLDYIHHCSGTGSGFVHNYVKSSSILVTDGLSAKICHFGTAELCGEIEVGNVGGGDRKIEGTRGYMAPEFQGRGIVTQKSDVYAFGVVVLELVSGEEALRYEFDESNDGCYRRVSVIERAREAVSGGAGGVRRWVDKRLKDSFPVEVAEKMVVLGLECVEDDPGKRLDMGNIAGRISKLYLESKYWAERIGMPVDFSVSVGPR